MIGTTRSRISFFMNKFRNLRLINYNGKIEVHNSLLSAVLHDKPEINTRTQQAKSSLIRSRNVRCIPAHSLRPSRPTEAPESLHRFFRPRLGGQGECFIESLISSGRSIVLSRTLRRTEP
jgi:hypothetical protein